jgi:DNA-binding winged helix-turn-helix (wHTH) protein
VLGGRRAFTLSVREFQLLVALARRMGATVTREQLCATVWGGELRPGDRSVDVHVSESRGKLERVMPDRRFIHTHQGFGYRFQPEPAREGAGRSAEHRSELEHLSQDLYMERASGRQDSALAPHRAVEALRRGAPGG